MNFQSKVKHDSIFLSDVRGASSNLDTAYEFSKQNNMATFISLT